MYRAWLPALLVLAAWMQSARADGDAEIPIGGRLRDVTLQGLNGPTVSLSQFRGRLLLINVWASWCEPCRAEMASLERLAWHAEGRRYAIIGISTDDAAEPPRELLARSHTTISHYLDSQRQMEMMLGASRIPLTVLVAPDGTVLDKVYGAQQWDSAASLARLQRLASRGTRAH